MASNKNGDRRRPQRPARNSDNATLMLVIGSIVGIFVTFIVLYMVPGLQSFAFQASKDGIGWEFTADGKVKIAETLEKLDENEIDKAGTVIWLRDNWSLYNVRKNALVEALTELCPDAPEGSLETYSQHIVNCEAVTSIRKLRERVAERAAPFQPPAKKVEIGTPATNPPPDGQAWTCFDGELENRRIQLVREGGEHPVEVVARGAYECPPGRKAPDIQLNKSATMRLFERPTREYETAYAIIL